MPRAIDEPPVSERLDRVVFGEAFAVHPGDVVPHFLVRWVDLMDGEGRARHAARHAPRYIVTIWRLPLRCVTTWLCDQLEGPLL